MYHLGEIISRQKHEYTNKIVYMNMFIGLLQKKKKDYKKITGDAE